MFSNTSKVDKILNKFHGMVAELDRGQETCGHEANDIDAQIVELGTKRNELVQEGQRAKSVANKLKALIS